MSQLSGRILYGRGLNLAAQLNPTRRPLPSFQPIETMTGAPIKKLGCGYLQSYYLLNDGQFVKAGYFMDSLTSIRIINLHRLMPRLISLMQKMPFLGKTLSFRGGDEVPTRFNGEIEPFQDISCGVSRVYGITKGGVYAMGENYFGQLGTRNLINFEHTFTKLGNPEGEEIRRVDCGFQHTLFTTKHDNVYGCGKASDYQIQSARYTQENQLSDKVEVPSLIKAASVVKAAGGLKFSLLWTEGDRLFTMGDNKFGQCGQNHILMPEVKRLTEVAIEWEKGETILDIASGFCHSLILTNRAVYFMGSVQQKQNPFKSFNQPICTPTPLPIDKPIKIFAGFDRSAVINSAGQAYIFGGRDYKFCGGEGGDLQILEGFSQESEIGLGFSHTLIYP